MTVFDDAARDAGFRLDDDQHVAADRLTATLTRLRARPGATLFARRHVDRRDRRVPAIDVTPRDRRHAPRPAASGVYLWGPVGRGKTWLLDRFCAAVPASAGAVRFHFHEFYRGLHAEVWARRGSADAVEGALDVLLDGARVLCFDELHLHDAGDAMLLSRALRAAFERDVVLVATSNYPPSGLLPDPLFHHLAEPLIDLLTDHLEVHRVAGPTDYRESDTRTPTRTGFRSGTLTHPAEVGGSGADPLPGRGDGRGPGGRGAVDVALVGGRSVRAVRVRGDEVWFDFTELCDTPVSAADMLGLTGWFRRWTVSDVVPFADLHVSVQQRFVSLVDVLHDRDLPLHLTAPVPLDELLAVPPGRPAPPDLARARSRLRQLRHATPTTHATAR